MSFSTSPQVAVAHAYRDIYEQSAIDVAFLWLLRAIAAHQPHYNAHDLAELDRRIDAHLELLMTTPDIAWEICAAALELEQPGEVFVATMLAFHSVEPGKIKQAVDAGLAKDETLPGIVSALGWLPGRVCHPWLKKFFTSKKMDHKYLAIAACSVRREDPGKYLNAIFQRDDCRAHTKLYARALRLVGEIKRHDRMADLRLAIDSDDPEIQFWATWSAVLLGKKTAVDRLKSFVFEPGPLQQTAINLAFRSLPIEEARLWINLLAKDVTKTREVIKATMTLGDPLAVSWLIKYMRAPSLARLAGEAFTAITGVDLEENQLAMDEAPEAAQGLSDDDQAEDDVQMDEDENLPFPDADKVAEAWRQERLKFVSGERYLLGRQITASNLRLFIETGSQRQRSAAALELALIERATHLPNSQAHSQVKYGD